MKISKQIKELIEHRDTTTSDVASKLNQSTPNLLNKLSRDNFRLSELQEIAEALQYTDMEIILRGSKEDAVILKDKVEYKEHNVYMMFDNNNDIIKDIEENGIREYRFKDLVFELIDENIKPLAGDTWNNYIPNEAKEFFKSMAFAMMAQFATTKEHLNKHENSLKEALDKMEKEENK